MCKYKPIEMPRSSHYGSNYYYTYSSKLKRNVTFYSQLEYHNFLTLEMNPIVKSFCEQPLKIEIEIDGKLETSIFDMWVKYKDGTEEFQEVKYLSEIQGLKSSTRSRDQIQRQKYWCHINGFKHSVRTDGDIYKGPYYISNLRFLHGSIVRFRCSMSENYLRSLRLFLKNGKCTVLEISQQSIIPGSLLFPLIAYGIYKGELDANLITSIFSYDTYIWAISN